MQRLIPLHNIDDGFDRQNLSIINKRFRAVNNDRLQRMRNALQMRHQIFLDALPILFHCNHPMLPGFVNRHTPCKIKGFKPNKGDISAAKTLARSFTINYDPGIPESIEGIYVMGSVGTIAQSDRSDLDIWLCYRPGMEADALKLLQQKCKHISEWADEQRLEAHFFLMDYEAFKRGRLSTLDKESSGSAQRLLLLDEFYRSAIHIAGLIPLWWYVPQKNEADYKNHTGTLLDRRFIAPNHVLDFGGVGNIPGGEFIGAGVWQLYKAIESPYKSVLKLLLLEVYVSEYPEINPLSLQFKQAIFNGEINIDKLDSYVMVYRRIEKYLQTRRQIKRLELARRCFYFKVGCALSKRLKHHPRPWQRELMRELVSEWQWSEEGIELLDARPNWKIATVSSERALLVNELNHSYQFLLEFAQQHGMDRSISAEELTVLGRKLQAAFERRPGKIEWINPNISKDLSEDEIIITCNQGHHGQTDIWTALAVSGPSAMRATTSIRSCTSFVELIVWCFYNGVIEAHTQLDLNNISSMDPRHARGLIDIFNEWLPDPQQSSEHESFFKAAQPNKVLLVLNVASSAQPVLQRQGLQRLSLNSDPLRYGGNEENLVASVDLISVNSWQEVHVRRFDKKSALLDALREYLELTLPDTHHAPPEIRIECLGGAHAPAISQRVSDWFSEINRCFYSKHSSRQRYIFQLAEQLHILQFIGMRPTVEPYTSEAKLVRALSAEQKGYSGITLDSRCLRESPLHLIAKKMRRNTISVFYKRFDIGMETYVVDEKGSLSHFVDRGHRHHNPLISLHRFLRATINRQARSQPDLLADFGICPIYFFELQRRPGYKMTARQTPISQSTRQSNIFEVKAIAFTDDNETIQFDFYCDDQEFSARSFMDQLYIVVAQFILSRRNNGENYPIYMTDLDLSLCERLLVDSGQLQLTHYLKIKNQLEAKLNEAIGVLVKA